MQKITWEFDRTRSAAEERKLLLSRARFANDIGFAKIAQGLLELDSETFDVTDEGVEWR